MALKIAHSVGTLYHAPVAEAKEKQRTVVRMLASAAGLNRWPPIRQKPISTCKSRTSPALCFHAHVEVAAEKGEKGKGKKGVGVFVMLPPASLGPTGVCAKWRKTMRASLAALKCAGVEGVTVDVWWGLVEREMPGVYEWSGYVELMEMAKRVGLKVQAVMSFHRYCDGNVGDSVTIPLPRWVAEEMEKDPDLAYTDRWGRRNYEYVSLGCDALPVLRSRSPVQCYADFMRAFRDNFSSFLGSTTVEIQVGMGPAGELRYPSYPELTGTWRFPGIGAFQCYDKYMLSSLKAAADAARKPEWGHDGPTDAGNYNDLPNDAPFFHRDGGWRTPYGDFFLSWYSQSLLNHCDSVLSAAASIFSSSSSSSSSSPSATLSVKIAGIHRHSGSQSHAAELTAGYHSTHLRDGYAAVAAALAHHRAVLSFTCLEICDGKGLVRQVAVAARVAGVAMAGENAVLRHDAAAYERIVEAARREGMLRFTYRRMERELFEPEKWGRFVGFVRRMGAEEREVERFAYEKQQFVKDASL